MSDVAGDSQHPLVDEAMEELAIAEACEPSDDYESEAGIKLFFDRLRNGWRVDRAGRMRPPKNLNITPGDQFGSQGGSDATT